MSITPNNPIIHVNLGNTLIKLWQLEEALLHYGEALHLNPDDDETKLFFLSTQRMLNARKTKTKQ